MSDTISEMQKQLAKLHREHPYTEMGEAAHLMIAMLDVALHGQTWARPSPPADVWLSLLCEVAVLRGETLRP